MANWYVKWPVPHDSGRAVQAKSTVKLPAPWPTCTVCHNVYNPAKPHSH